MWAPLPDDLQPVLAARGRLGLFAERIHYVATTTSTNDVLRDLAEAGAPEATVVVADAQTSGRGRLGRSWFSPPGAGLYVSALFRPPLWPAPDRAPASRGLTLMAGVALAQAIRAAAGLEVELKWPNDLVVPAEARSGPSRADPGAAGAGRSVHPAGPAGARRHAVRKLGGILAEGSAPGGRVQHVVLGFGINVREAAYPPNLAGRATSIERELGRSMDRAALLIEALAHLAEGWQKLVDGRFDAILAAWRSLACGAEGAAVEWRDADRRVRGMTAGVDAEGYLLLIVGGRLERVVSGEIEWM